MTKPSMCGKDDNVIGARSLPSLFPTILYYGLRSLQQNQPYHHNKGYYVSQATKGIRAQRKDWGKILYTQPLVNDPRIIAAKGPEPPFKVLRFSSPRIYNY